MGGWPQTLKKMLPEFIKLGWRPYLAAVAFFSLVLAAVFSVTSGESGLGDLIVLAASILLVAVPVTLLLAMPLAYWGWSVQQRSFPELSQTHATWIGFGAGALLHTTFLMFFGGWMALPQILLFTVICGGGYGASFAFFFSRWGGLKQINGEQVDADQPTTAVDLKSE